MSIMAKTPSGYKKIGSAYLGERPVDKVFNANGDVVYALQRELTGVPPLLFKGKEQSELLNYRIYGDTVDGNSVGDLVESGEHAGEYKVPVTVEGKNLFSSRIEQGSFDGITGAPNNLSTRVRSHEDDYIFLTPGVYKISAMGVEHFIVYAYDLPDVNAFNYNLSSTYWAPLPSTITINTSAYYKFGFCKTNNPIITPSDISNIMLNTGSTALPYEPYHAPVTTPIYLPEPIKMVGDEAEYIDYAEQKQHRVRKNLLQNIATSQTRNGVTFTVNSDGSVTCNGTASATIDYRMVALNSYSLPAGNYRLTGAPPTANYSSYYLRAWYNSSGSVKGFIDVGNGTNFSLTDTTILLCAIIIASQQVLNNVTFYPMIRKADISDDTYEPYIENTEVDVTLPALPTIKGTNTMSVDTEVQPSRMDIKGRIKTLT